MTETEKYFLQFRNNIVGINHEFEGPYGSKRLLYADWIASGRLYRPIEEKIINDFGPLIGNTHSQTSITGTTMTLSYHLAQNIIKKHCNADTNDIIITAGSGMTTVINKFQRLLGLSFPEQLRNYTNIPAELKPVVFITHMEHHSNQTSWLESIADVIVIPPDKKGLVDIEAFKELLHKHKERNVKIGSFSACSNVTGIETPYHEMAELIHSYDGICFVDFAASAPYVKIDMHPDNPKQRLDAIFFSPHKFLGGPGTPGVLIFDRKLYNRHVPDQPGGGTVDWTDPWGHYKFVDDIEAREDGGTPAFLQTIKAALCIQLKEKMQVSKIRKREREIMDIVFPELLKIDKLHILASDHSERLGVISFYAEDIHYNLFVRLLNDMFGIQLRGGCSCAGTYGHYLLHVDPTRSKRITDKINRGDLSEKPGWVRLSLHPTMTNDEAHYIIESIKEVITNSKAWEKDYDYSSSTNEYTYRNGDFSGKEFVSGLFNSTFLTYQ